jgi:hypothetical protein
MTTRAVHRRSSLQTCRGGPLVGFATTYAVNWWLIRRGIKDIM